ncbi:HAD family hydrolase [Gluconacetobacter azotocaptans]|uniref:HAD family hydrolase n=1 Tax=Gluconacetobacter azotocaptans TaxID=142834 RepID=A0A7W4JQK3_9PROT|nr:Cof-type HAD-IIB family hydrolase [Gluconacetobacter azotocaptans]MBB2189098.1 HAD family hydrolase [Gluconacetobacter azotocaptans]MBM9403311.1 HAD family hydrolase [Gluconacetobacter azotocaptans]GBQ27138.1 hydrolase [Gluconacetobacter azotocaptans DSM 13594]
MSADAAPMARAAPSGKIRLVVSDIDGTLVTRDKRLTPAVLAAARSLRAAGVGLCLVSSRAPRGMEMFLGPLAIDTPRAGLNGGLIAMPDGTIVSRLSLDPDAVRQSVEILQAHRVDPWLFIGHDWMVTDPAGPYVARERQVVQTDPVVVPDFDAHTHNVGKIMGASSDYPLLARMEAEIGALLAGRASVHRSSDYYLDITHSRANKGYAALELARLMNVDIGEVACIGDMYNDVPMLDEAGVAIAMGNAPDGVKAHAHFVTASNEQDGWAHAIERYVLPRV